MKDKEHKTKREKKSLLAEVRANPKAPLRSLPVSLSVILPFCICLVIAFVVVLSHVGDKAFRYSDQTYADLVLAISETVQPGVGLDSLPFQKKLKSLAYPKEDSNFSALPEEDSDPSVLTKEDSDSSALPEEDSDSSALPEEDSDSSALPEEDSDSPIPSEKIPRFTCHYENDQTVLTCSIQDGYFLAEVTAILSSDYEIQSNSRNFNSQAEYMVHILIIFGLTVLISALIGFFGFTLVVSILLCLYGVIANWIAKRKEEKNLSTESPVPCSEPSMDSTVM